MATQGTKGSKAKAAARITCYAPDAREIVIAGSFNAWNAAGLAMTRDAEGQWSADVDLPPGRYEYKFFVDGVWCCEPHLKSDHADGEECVSNPFGTSNRVLLVR